MIGWLALDRPRVVGSIPTVRSGRNRWFVCLPNAAS
jgi:hypothetical protein